MPAHVATGFNMFASLPDCACGLESGLVRAQLCTMPDEALSILYLTDRCDRGESAMIRGVHQHGMRVQAFANQASPHVQSLVAAGIPVTDIHWRKKLDRAVLTRIRDTWAKMKKRLTDHLIPSIELSRMLQEAGAPADGNAIGVPPPRLAASYRQAYHIRRRYTVLDLAERAGVFDACVARIYGSE